MSAIFQRPLCDMGKAYDFSFRPLLGEPDTGAGGPCDDRPHRVEMFESSAEPHASGAAWQSFSLCPEHEHQLRGYDDRLRARSLPSRFRPISAASPVPPSPSETRREARA